MKKLFTPAIFGMANMKKIMVVLSFIWIASNFTNTNNVAAQSCCPEFNLQDAVEICPPQGACGTDGAVGQHASAACKLSYHEYTVYPNDPFYTYTWTVIGGTPANTTGNPNIIQWGSGSTGFIKVVISNIPSGGTCVDSVFLQICLIDGPQADFTPNPDTVCQFTPVSFTNNSVGGSAYFWDFGDGNTSILANPTHAYSLPGNYTVTLKVTDMGSGQYVLTGNPPRETLVPCGCSDTISKQIVVLPGQGPIIEKDCCFGTVCPGDTTTLCTPQVCGTYNWVVTNGTIISPPNSSCIQVKWNATYTGPTTVSLTVPGCGSAPCGGTTTIDVPVLYPNLPIVGPTTLCVGASGTYTLPTLPGTYYTWTVNGGFYTFNQVDRNSPSVNITFNTQGTYWVRCDYNNPLAGCNGVDSIQVDVKPVYSIFGDDKVCEGSTISYNGFFGPANWVVSPPGPVISGSPGSPINVTWLLPGTYYLKAAPVNASAFCNDTAVKKVEVIALPILNNIIGVDSICPGKNLTFSISSNTSGSPFMWQITGGTGQILSYMGADKDSIVVKFNAIPPGPWQLSVYQEIEINPGVFCQSLTMVKNIYPFLAPNISGQTNVCVDAVESYTAGGSNLSGNFQWTISPASQGTIQSGQGSNTVQILWHGTPTTATLTVSTCSGSDQININILNPPVKPAITALGPTNYCLPSMPNNLQLSVPNIYSTYQWYHNGILFGQTSSSYLIP